MNYVLRYILIPNFVFAIFNLVATSSRPIINLDYCIVGILTPFIGRYWGVLLYLFLFVLDLVASFAPTYHLKPVILLTIFRELSAFEPTTLALLSVLLISPILLMWFFTLKRDFFSSQQLGLRSRSTLIIASLIIIILDIMNASNGLVRTSETTSINYNIAGSALWKISHDIKITSKKKIPPIVLQESEYAMSRVHANLIAGTLPLQNIVLVIVESWGISTDSTLNAAIVKPLSNPKLLSRYQVLSSVVPFHGSTVPAELRELYGLRASGPQNVEAATSISAMLASKDYETYALHGFMPNFFGRDAWYPKAGFRNIIFINDIKKLQPTDELCGSTNFRGSCDDKMPSLIKQLLLGKNGVAVNTPKFIYWLTLNSHYPYATPSHSSHFACESFGLSEKNQGVCNLSTILYGVFSSLADLIEDTDIPPTRFIIVGDHSPPFLMRSNEGLYNNAYVPMIELIPKMRETVH